MQTEPIVETAYGRLCGLHLKHVFAFLGVPYARAARFEAPDTPEAWAAVRDAKAFGPIAPQSDTNNPPTGYGIVLEHLGGPPPPPMPESEDCQTLNIWSSDLSPEKPKPVMVWLHPGFFMLGSGASGNGVNIAARGDAVVVSLNHRLNVFGYCHLDDLSGDFRHSGNAGMMDIVAALQWVRDNIHAFGGDPKRVMVFGASGGGMKTAWLSASPVATGLLHRAGAQSGPGLSFMERADASRISEQLLSELGLSMAQVSDLRRVAVSQLLAAYHRIRVANRASRFTHLPFFSPVIDPNLLPRHPYAPDADPQAAAIPMLLGWNQQDMAFFTGTDLSVLDLDEAGLEARVAQLDSAPEQLIEQYRAADRFASCGDIYLRLFSDWSIGQPVITQATHRAEAGKAATFVYRYDLASPALNGKLGAVHSSETPLLFGNPGPLTPTDDKALALGAAMQDAWVNFAATGNPNTGSRSLPDWPEFNVPSSRIMSLSGQPKAIANPIPDFSPLPIF